MNDAIDAVFQWLGSDDNHIDIPYITHCGDVVVGCYGGTHAVGATKNEDGALVWSSATHGWTLAILCDAHNTTQSADLVLSTMAAHWQPITEMLARPPAVALPSLRSYVLDVLSSATFRSKSQHVQGETACLLCVQKDQFLLWVSIGDCMVYVLHPELAQLGQYALNQRSFFEWIGHVNTFDLAPPCYTTGIRELRPGRNAIVMLTDGVLECGTRPFETPHVLYQAFVGPTAFQESSMEAHVRSVLERVRAEQGRDSATLIAWAGHNRTEAAYPSWQRGDGSDHG